MVEILTPDGHLASHVEGDGFSLAIGVEYLNDEAIAQFTGQKVDARQPKNYTWRLLGRSGLGIIGVDTSAAPLPAVVAQDMLYIPIDIDTYTNSSERLIERLGSLKNEHKQGELLQWNDRRVPFGRLLDLSGVVMLEKLELEDAVEQNLLGFGAHTQDGEPDVEIMGDAITLPLALLELEPDTEVFSNADSLLEFLQSKSGRNVLDKMQDKVREPGDILGAFTVGTVFISTGPYICRMVGAVSSAGEITKITQLPSAAWLDQERSKGFSPDIPANRQGRHTELWNPNRGDAHTWEGMRLLVEVYRPKPSHNGVGAAAYRTFLRWQSLNMTERTLRHHTGSGGSIPDPALARTS